MPLTDGRALLDALLLSWDRHQQVMLNLLRMIPAPGLTARALPGSPTVAQMFAHMHHERMISLQENAPEHAGTVPAQEWPEGLEAALLETQFVESGQRVRDAVAGRIEAGAPLDRDFPHPLFLLQFLMFHESYHHGQIKLALKATGAALPDDAVGPLIYDVWRAGGQVS